MKKAKKRLGSNELRTENSLSFIEKLKEEAKDESARILFFLVIAETFSYLIGRFVLGLGSEEKYSVVMVFAITAIVIFSGAWRSYKQEKGAMTLTQENDSKSNVYRDGVWREMSSNHIECGDIVRLKAGDRIPADGYIVKGTIKVNQSAINGRSQEEVEKVPLDDITYWKREHKALSGKFKCFRESIVTSGVATMEVTEVGKDTFVGQRRISEKRDRMSPGDEKTKKIFKFVSMFGYFGGAFVAIRALTLGIWDIVNTGDISFGIIAYTVLNAIMMGVSIIVMAVPEGLPLIGGLIQGLNVKNMHKDNIFVRNPKAVETAGYVTRLFVNKTGILTSGDMSVANVIIGSGRTYTRFENLAKTLQEQITIGAGVNNEAIVNPENRAFGSDEIDVALLQYLLDNKVEIDKSEVISSEAFNSIAKFTTITMSDGTKYIKGAPDVVMNDCDNFLDEYGNEQQMNEDVKKKLSRNMRMQKVRAMRVIALAKIFEGKKTIIALISIKNEAREDARNAIARLRRAGITVTMVTGDDLITAVSIAKATGLTGKHSDVCLSHNDLMRMSDDELINVLPNLKVVARAEPEDKERLIRLSHQMDEVVGITGNNVNDVSILNKADVSFAVMSATEFAKGVADIIILNNSLKTIGDVIKYGRTTGKTIKKFIVFQLTVNVSSVITAIIGPFLGSGEVFTIVQMLWINMVMDVLAAMAFAQEPPQEAYMLEKPIPRTADIINTYVKSAVAVCGVLITVICLGILTDVNGIHNLIGSSEESVVKTFMFATFIFLIIMNSLNARTQSLNLFEHITQNRNFILVMSFVAVMQITIIQVLGQIFGTVPLSLHNWICVILISMVIIPVDFIRKIIVKKMGICE